jgi:LCP family protein required for cell wall assembly
MGPDPASPPPALRRRPGPSYRVQVATRALCALVSLAVIVISGVAWASYQNFTATIPHGAPVPPLRAGQVDPDGPSTDILLVGDDTRAGATPAELKALHAGRDQTTVNADTMMVLHIPASGAPPSVVSFPRDSWVTIPGHGQNKLNAAYPLGYNAAREAGAPERQAESAGINLTIRTIELLTGLHIDHYMQVDLLGFYRISEAIGGVRVCLKEAQNAHTESGGTRSYSGINLPKGWSVIKGEQALAFVRQRHGLPHGDLDRIKRQQYFLRAAFAKITSAGMLLNPFKLHRLLNAVGRSLLVDPGLDLIALARQFETLTSGNIDFATIPNNGAQLIYPDGVETSIVQVNRAAIPAFVAGLDGKADAAYAAAPPADPATVTVDVLNGTDIARLAARNARALVALGFRVDTVDSAAATQATVVEYPAGREAQAKAVVHVLVNAKPVRTPGVARVTVVLGADRHWVRGVAPAGAAAAPAHRAARKDPTHGLGCID